MKKNLQLIIQHRFGVCVGIILLIYELLLRFSYDFSWIAVMLLLCIGYGGYALVRGIFGSQKPLYLKRTGIICGLFFVTMIMGGLSDGFQHESNQRAAKEAEEAARKKAQEPYNKQAQYEEGLAWQEQEVYDKQAQYEEWIAWKEGQEKQERYDKQAQYEEWLAWQQQQAEEEVRQREEAARAEAEEKSKYQTVSAIQMIRDYDANAMTAKSKYLNQKARVVRAHISAIDTDGSLLISSPNVDDICFIVCNPSSVIKGRSISSIQKGDIVTVYGEVTSVGAVVGQRSDIGEVRGYRMKVTRIE